MRGAPPKTAGISRKALTFGLVSIATTLLDFGLFNIFVRFETFPLLLANTISYGAGIVASYLLNKSLTFAGGGREKRHHEIALFVLINVAGLWLNNLAVVFAARAVSEQALVLNGAKLAAGVATWVLKFYLFERLVYPQRKG